MKKKVNISKTVCDDQMNNEKLKLHTQIPLESIDNIDQIILYQDTLESLPYPAMYIRYPDRLVLMANNHAQTLGAKVGETCWQSFGNKKNKYYKDELNTLDRNTLNKYSKICEFCQADQCFTEGKSQKGLEIQAFGKIWDAHWSKISESVFLHFLVDITLQKMTLDKLKKNEFFLKQTQEIAKLGTYFFDIENDEWTSSDVLDKIFGYENTSKRTMADWLEILHPDNKDIMIHYFTQELIGKRNPTFDKEYKIIRKNDGQTVWVHGLGHLTYDDQGNALSMIGTIQDITERKNEQFKVIRNFKFTEVLLKSIPTPVFFKDLEGKYTGCNEAFTNQLGVSNEAIIGKTVMELWPSELAQIYHDHDLKLMQTRDFQTYESQILDKNKQLRDVVYAKNVFCDENGEVAGIVGAFIDITEHKKKENIIRENEEKLRTVANYTIDWEYWTDPQGFFNYCSASCERITGYTQQEFINDPQLIDKILYPEDLKVYLKTKKNRSKSQSKRIQFEYRIIRKNGSIRWIGHVSAHIFNEKGEYLGIRGSNRDITSRKDTEALLKASEHKYKMLSENISEGIFTCKNGYIEHVNKSMSVIFGYTPKDLLGIKLQDLILPEFQIEFDKFLDKNISNTKSKSIEVECLRKDNTSVFVEITLNSIENQEIQYGVIHDITIKKQLHKKDIVSAIIETEENERANFSKELHDGLGPLLSAIKMYLQWSRKPNKISNGVEIILKAEDILEEAIVTVKEISNKLSPHLLMNYGLTSATQSFVNKLLQTREIDIEFTSNLNRRLNNEVEIALYRAIIECINNTIKYADAKKIQILINDMGTQIQLIYLDNGKGFEIEKILDKKKGLGLLNLQNRIQSIGGEIQLYAKLKKGVKYMINVPLSPSN
jgi:PAS domain S-box-containing protein